MKLFILLINLYQISILLNEFLLFISNIIKTILQLSKYLDKFKNAGKVVKEKSIKELELKKLKVEFVKKKFNLGTYISSKYLADKILDFSYDEEFKLMMEEIISLKEYIDSIESS